MKLIGTTDKAGDKGGYLWELTEQENRLLKLAQEAANGLEQGDQYIKFPRDGQDMEPVFGALALWIRARFATNALQRVVDSCRAVITPTTQELTEDEKRRHEEWNEMLRREGEQRRAASGEGWELSGGA